MQQEPGELKTLPGEGKAGDDVVLETVADNYGKANDWRQRIHEWQEWWGVVKDYVNAKCKF